MHRPVIRAALSSCRPPSRRPAEYMAYMLKYDSVHGRLPHDVHGDGSGLWIDGEQIKVHAKL